MKSQIAWIPGWEERYAVTSSGQIYSFLTGEPRLRKQSNNDKGYKRVTLWDKKRSRMATMTVHRIVMLTFIGPRPKLHEINHLDGDKTNNRLSNLEYVTPLENNAHATRNKLKRQRRTGYAYADRVSSK